MSIIEEYVDNECNYFKYILFSFWQTFNISTWMQQLEKATEIPAESNCLTSCGPTWHYVETDPAFALTHCPIIVHRSYVA